MIRIGKHIVTLLSCGLMVCLSAYAAGDGARWPGVKVTYFAGPSFDKPVLTTYEPELRHDGWVPVSRKGSGTEPFAIRYECELRVDQEGAYWFRPDGRTGLDGNLLVNGAPVAWTTETVEVTDRGKTRSVERPVSKPVRLNAGTVSLRWEIVNKDGRSDRRSGLELWWGGPTKARAISPARISVTPWPDMKQRPILRYAMIGHSNVEGRTTSRPVEAKHAWSYNPDARVWAPMTAGYGNHTSGLVAALSEKYPEYHFGGMMLGQGGSNLCDQWLAGQTLEVRARRVVKTTAWCGPLMAMGSHFDWDEIKQQWSIDSYEKNYGDLIARFRQDFGLPELPWIIARLGPGFCTWGPGGGANNMWGNYKTKFFPGPDMKGSPGYNTLYHAVDHVAEKLPPIRVVTVDDFVERWENKGKGGPAPENPDTDVMHFFTIGFEKWVQRAIPLLEDMGAIQAAIARLDEKPQPYEAVAEIEPRWPVSNDPAERMLIVRGTISRVSKARAPKDLAPYRDALMAVEYRVQDSYTQGDPYLPERIVVLMPSVLDGKATVATGFTVGMEHDLALASWDPQPEAIKRWPVDDDIQEMELPLFYMLSVHEISKTALWKRRGGDTSGAVLTAPASPQ